MRFVKPALLGLALACGGVCAPASAAVLITDDEAAPALPVLADSDPASIGAPGSYFDGSRPASEGDTAESVATRQFAVGVPEPGTWALILFGFAVVGAAVRRRKTTVPHFT